MIPQDSTAKKPNSPRALIVNHINTNFADVINEEAAVSMVPPQAKQLATQSSAPPESFLSSAENVTPDQGLGKSQ